MLNGDDVCLWSEYRALPSGPVAFGFNGENRWTDWTSEIRALRDASDVSELTQNLKWSPSIVSGVVALVIWTVIDSIGVSATNPMESPRFNWKAAGKPSKRIAFRCLSSCPP